MTITLKQLGLIAVILLAALAMIYATPQKQASAVGPLTTNLGYNATSSTKILSITTSSRIGATTTNPLDPTNSFNRVYAVICNLTATSAQPIAGAVYLSLNGDRSANIANTALGGLPVLPGACFTINDTNQYNGSIQASSSLQLPMTVSFTEYVQ